MQSWARILVEYHVETLRELSLFSGAGGGLLGTTHLLGWQTVCYVEWDSYASDVLCARIADGVLCDAPIWTDVWSFDPHPWRGHVDVISAGFPCQPFSVAGMQRAGDDPRDGWPPTVRIIRAIRPKLVYLENVAGLLAGSHGYFGRVLGELAEMGYDARWCVLSAGELGAPHRSDRLWVRAELRNSDGNSESTRALDDREAQKLCGVASDSNGIRLAQSRQPGRRVYSAAQREGQNNRVINDGIWATEPDVGRVANGVASRLDKP